MTKLTMEQANGYIAKTAAEKVLKANQANKRHNLLLLVEEKLMQEVEPYLETAGEEIKGGWKALDEVLIEMIALEADRYGRGSEND